MKINDETSLEACDGYDQIADFYDEDMGRNNPGKDIKFYVEMCCADNAHILELGCGTGRITLPLVKSGCRVTGVDRSAQMLGVLREKACAELNEGAQKRLRLRQTCVTSLAFGKRFSHIICPFSAITYVVSRSGLEQTLSNIRAHLAESGKFIFDVFVPNAKMMAQPDAKTIYDYRRQLANGLLLERSKSIRQNVVPGVNEIARHYRFSNADGKITRSFMTVSRIRYYYPDQISFLLKRHGFEIVAFYGDFQYSAYRDGAATAVFVCR